MWPAIVFFTPSFKLDVASQLSKVGLLFPGELVFTAYMEKANQCPRTTWKKQIRVLVSKDLGSYLVYHERHAVIMAC